MKKGKLYEEVPIRNLADLVNVVNYNAESLGRQIRKIAKNRRHLTILSGVVTGLAIVAAYQRQKMEDQVYNLSVRVKKLESSLENSEEE